MGYVAKIVYDKDNRVTEENDATWENKGNEKQNEKNSSSYRRKQRRNFKIV